MIGKGKIIMAEVKKQKLISWLITRPALFAITSALFMFIVAFGYSTITGTLLGMQNPPQTPVIILMILAFLTAAAMLIHGLPPQNLDRRSFVAINNAQTLIASIAFITSTLVIIANAQNIMLRMLWMETHSTTSFVALMISVSLFYLYLSGLYISGLYAKYRRIRAMGVPMWRIICTAPFGFAMLWIPGYMLPTASVKNPALELQTKWYARLTDWVIARPTNTAASFVVLMLLSSFFFGFNVIMLTLGIAIAFAIWVMTTGVQKFRENIAGAYTWTAIVLNIISWIAVIFIAIYSARTPNNINITINDTVETQQITQ